ncbi:MAG: hypothetical protein Q9170_005491 [Blastenia crenularia]
MPSTLFTIITSISAAIIGLFSAPLLQQYGLVPYFATLSNPPAFAPSFTLFDHSIFAPEYHHFGNDTSATSTLLPFNPPTVVPPIDTQKPSSSTATAGPHTPPVTSSQSAFTFFRLVSARLIAAILTIIAAGSLWLADFILRNPPIAQTSAVVIKKRTPQQPDNAVLTESDFLIYPPLNTYRQQSQPTYIDQVAEMTTWQPPVSPASSPVTTPTPPPQPSAPRFLYRPDALPFTPLAVTTTLKMRPRRASSSDTLQHPTSSIKLPLSKQPFTALCNLSPYNPSYTLDLWDSGPQPAREIPKPRLETRCNLTPANTYVLPTMVQGHHGVTTWQQKPDYQAYKSPYGPNGITAGSFGVVALVAVLQFGADVPKVRTDIMQKLPLVGDYFIRETPPSDNVSILSLTHILERNG